MVSSEPLDSPPLLPLSALSASGSFSLSSSGSIQSRLSSFNSEQRLRSLPSVTSDLEKQADPDSDDDGDEADDYDSNRTPVKQRFWWLVRVFVSFSALFFPISVFGGYVFPSHRPPAGSIGEDYESGLYRCRDDRDSTNGSVRPPAFSLGKRAALVQDNHPRSSTFAIPLL